jgi:hypothetical protein
VEKDETSDSKATRQKESIHETQDERMRITTTMTIKKTYAKNMVNK